MAFSFLRIFYCNFLQEMRRVRLPPFSSKTDPDFASLRVCESRVCESASLRVVPENVTTVG
jgi:hypothetical protein